MCILKEKKKQKPKKYWLVLFSHFLGYYHLAETCWNRDVALVQNPHRVGESLQLKALSRRCNQGLEGLKGGLL